MGSPQHLILESTGSLELAEEEKHFPGPWTEAVSEAELCLGLGLSFAFQSILSLWPSVSTVLMAEEQPLLLPGSIAGTATMSSIYKTKLTELIGCSNGKTERKISCGRTVWCAARGRVYVGGRNEPQPGEPWASCSCTWNLLSLCHSWVRIPAKLRPQGHCDSSVWWFRTGISQGKSMEKGG